MRRYMADALVAGAGLWILSEILEIAFGGIGSASLGPTLVAFAALAFGSMALHWGQVQSAGALSRIGAGLLALGFAAFTLVSLALVAGSYGGDEEVAASGGQAAWLLNSGIGALLLGTALFLAAAVRAEVYPRVGLGLLGLAMVGYVVVGVAEIGGIAGNLVNMAMAVSLLILGRTAHRRLG